MVSWETGSRDMSSALPMLATKAIMESFEREGQTARDPTPYDMWSSWVKSTMEMSLRHFIDPAHQGSHAHRGLLG